MAKVRWGILSTAKIGLEHVIPALQRSASAQVVAIASRTLRSARKAADRLQIPKALGSYDDLIRDPDVDAIYNPLPNHLHVPWSIRAIEAGKHVLCEKPIGLTSDEGRQLLATAEAHPNIRVMEAFMYRHHPQWHKARQLIQTGKLGSVRTLQSFFSYFNTDPKNIRNRADIGGGGLMDIGCYNISMSRFLFQAEPRRVVGIVEYDTKFKTDRLATAILDFGSGTSAFTCSTQLSPYQRVNIFGTEARLEIEIPFNAPCDRPCRMWLQMMGQIEEITVATCDQYAAQGELMSRAILDQTRVPTPLADAVANMRVIEAIKASAAQGQWVTLPHDGNPTK